MSTTDPTSPTADRRHRTIPWRRAAWSAAVLLLISPLVAMQVTSEVRWSVADFALLGTLILGTGLTLELAANRTRDLGYRWGVGVALVAAVLLVVVNGAVGMIGSEDTDVNLLFGGVIAVALVGSLVARFRPRGMARAMAAAALAQAAIAIGALAAGLTAPATHQTEIIALWGIVALWVGSAALFRKSASRRRAVSDGLITPDRPDAVHTFGDRLP